MPFLLKIGERGHSWAGRPPLTSVHNSREEAEAELTQYIRDNGDQQMDGDELPQDEAELVEQYFDFVLEPYEIFEVLPPFLPADDIVPKRSYCSYSYNS
jgi:hypothetical protein